MLQRTPWQIVNFKAPKLQCCELKMIYCCSKHQEAVSVFLDFAAAFDSIDPNITLGCLQARYGVAGTPLECWDSYLRGCTQSVNVGGTQSDPRSQHGGVPHRSVLLLSVFSMYVDPSAMEVDIITIHVISHMSYADDAHIYSISLSKHHVAVQHLDLCICDIKSWTVHDKLMFNDSKKEDLHILLNF